MNLTLSLGIDGDAATAVKKRKVVDGGVDVGAGAGDMAMIMNGGDRIVKKAEGFDRGEDGGIMAATSDGGSGMELVHLLLSAVAAGEAGDARAAAAALREVYRRASRRGGGEPGQRVAACYADALASRLPSRSPAATATATRAERFLAYTMFYQASPFYQFAHFTANQAIVEAFDAAAAGRRRRLHVVDFDVSYGFQWPSLIQSLSDAAVASGGDDAPAVSLRITGFGAIADELHETEARLVRFAAACPNLQFEFDGVLTTGSLNTRHDIDRVRIDDDTTVVVNLVFPASSQNAVTTSSTMAHYIIQSLNPSMVFLIEKHDGGGDVPTGLLPRFAAGLRYYAAVFDSLHECLPADSDERLAIERNHLGREIAYAVASLHHHHHRHGHGSSWKEAMEGAGLEGVRLSSRTVSQAKLLLKMKSGGCGGGGGFRVVEGDAGMAMSLAWRDMILATATVWQRRQRCR